MEQQARTETHSTGDRVVSIVLLIASALLAAALIFAGFFLVMATDSCGSVGECDTGLFVVGWVLSVSVPAIGFLATLVLTLVRLAQSRTAFWVPLAGTTIFCLLYAGAVALAFSAVS